MGGRAKHAVATLVEQGLGRLTATQYHAVTGGVARAQAARGGVPARLVHVGERVETPVASSPLPGLRRPWGGSWGSRPAPRWSSRSGARSRRRATGRCCGFARVADAVPEAWLVVAGREGSDTEALRRLQASLSACERVCFLGHRDDVAAVLARADVIVCSSWREGAAGALSKPWPRGSRS